MGAALKRGLHPFDVSVVDGGAVFGLIDLDAMRHGICARSCAYELGGRRTERTAIDDAVELACVIGAFEDAFFLTAAVSGIFIDIKGKANGDSDSALLMIGVSDPRGLGCGYEDTGERDGVLVETLNQGFELSAVFINGQIIEMELICDDLLKVVNDCFHIFRN